MLKQRTSDESIDRQEQRERISSSSSSLRQTVIEANELGSTFDLGDAHYGPATWATGSFVKRPSPYYYFLAGWCQLHKASRVIEVGTHFGGSTLALLKGMDKSPSARLVTMDVTDLNGERLRSEPAIHKIVGSGADTDIQKQAIDRLGQKEGCDLLYIDALKDKNFVFDVLDGFTSRIDVKYAILDDINIAKSMKEMWLEVTERYGDNAVNISTVCPSVRAENVGFGVIKLVD